MVKYLMTKKKDNGSLIKKDHYIEKCGDCPDMISGICIRTGKLVDINSLNSACPLPDF